MLQENCEESLWKKLKIFFLVYFCLTHFSRSDLKDLLSHVLIDPAIILHGNFMDNDGSIWADASIFKKK